MRIQDQLIKHEGIKLLPYQDTVGKWTIGVGRNFDDVPFSTEELVELFTLGLYEEWLMTLLDNDIKRVESEIKRFNWYDLLSDVRKKVIIDMVFNLGLSRFNGFKKTISYLSIGDYENASIEMLDSKWAKHDVGKVRSQALSDMMRTNEDMKDD